MSASIGLATTRSTTGDAQSLLAHADAAQYRAKQAGRNCVEIFDIKLRASLERRLDDEQQMRRAIHNGEIVAWYQPIVDLTTGRIVGAEALARWIHPTRGTLDAFRFVPLVEECGLILALDDCIIRQVVEAATRLAKHAHPSDFRIWCNTSAIHFSRTSPASRLSHLLERTGCDGNMIGFEITETALLEDPRVAAREICRARELGIKTALDDFGVGHSSLTLLRSLPVDAVKIDKSFVRDLTRSTTAAGLVRCIAELTSVFDIDAVAEGVEMPEQAQILRNYGCRYGQGHLWARAAPFDQICQQIVGTVIGPAPLTGQPTNEPDTVKLVSSDWQT